MQPITSYAKDDRIRVVIQGPPKAGKSVLAMQFPKPYFIDLDGNLGGPMRWIERENAKRPADQQLAMPVGYDVVDRDEKGAVVSPLQRYTRLNKLLQEAQANPDIETIVVDSATQLSQLIIDEVLRDQGKPSIESFKDGRQFWGFFRKLSIGVFGALKTMRKHIVLPVHEKINKDKDGNFIYPVKIAWPGETGNNLGAYFTDVWRCETQVTPKGLEKEYKFVVRTMPDAMYELGNGLGLPPVFEFKWETIQQKLQPTTKCPSNHQ